MVNEEYIIAQLELLVEYVNSIRAPVINSPYIHEVNALQQTLDEKIKEKFPKSISKMEVFDI